MASMIPDCVFPPGDTLREVLAERGMSQAELARRTGRPMQKINELVRGKLALEPSTALQLERALGIPASFWGNLERQYREHLARRRDADELATEGDWLRQFPLSDMAKLGWITRYPRDVVAQARELLSLFGVASPDQWRARWAEAAVAYKRTRTVSLKPGPLSAWRRVGEREAEAAQCDEYQPQRFRQALDTVRSLTVEDAADVFNSHLPGLCADAGVALVLVPELKGLGVNGATYWVRNGKRPVIQLSLRYKWADILWFAFFHEAGHILIHGRREFLEYAGSEADEEREADDFAAGLLIPRSDFMALKAESPRSAARIRHWATRLGIAPGLVVGRLQHERLLPKQNLNGLKVRLKWSEPCC